MPVSSSPDQNLPPAKSDRTHHTISASSDLPTLRKLPLLPEKSFPHLDFLYSYPDDIFWQVFDMPF